MKPKERKEAKERFLESLRVDPNVSLACDKAEISRETAYRWRDGDETFKTAWEKAIERTRDVARSSIYQRGILGWLEPAISNGQLVYEMEPVLDEGGHQVFDKGKPLMKKTKPVMIPKWSDTLAVAYAKANLPEYKEKQQIDLNAQITTLAETAKAELLANLASTIADENKEQAQQQ
jgi:hypothetical protein